MASGKNAKKKKTPKTSGGRPPGSDAYEKAVVDFQAAIERLHAQEWDQARAAFRAIAQADIGEPVLAERARSYVRICDQRLEPADAGPKDLDDRFYRAVVLSNDGQWDDAIRLLDEAIQERPNEARLLYARASAWALKGNADSAIRDLRQAIQADPKSRFQAVNDPDFERVREEPAFIDIIEPTPTGA